MTMGVSLLSAMIGFAFAALGVILLVLRKNKKFAITSLVIGGLLIIIPFALIYLLIA